MSSVKGFTLMELLIVIVIISILASLAIVGVMAAFGTAKDSSTEAMIRSMEGALNSYRMVYGDFPPSSLDRIRPRMALNDMNNGIESFVACVSTKKRSEPFWRPPSEGLYCNMDNDKADVNVTDWYFGDKELREVKDFFGNVLYYIHSSDYEQPGPKLTRVLMRTGEKPVDVKPQKNTKTNTWGNFGKFQILSAGKDGIFGTADDIKGW